MMRWLCWHDWSKWKTYRWQGTIYPSGEPVVMISRTQQARVCSKCGKEVHRRVREADGSEYTKIQEVAG